MSDGNTLRCAGIQRFVDTYLDSEFAESEHAEFERHLQECEACRKKVKVQADWRIAIRAAAPRERAPAALRNRVQRSIALEAKKKSGAQRSWRTFATRVLPLAAAAGLVGTFMMSRMSMSPVAADIIAKHQRNMPIEVTGPVNQVRRWYSDKLNVPVNPPILCKTCQLRGGRLAEVANQQAAYLMYDDNGNKVSVFIFDPSSVPLELPDKTTVDSRDVYLDQEHGYNVAVFRDHGVGYAIAGDLDRQQMLKFVSAAVSQP